jgi:glycosyltransferase involved in cell wall biosynthesis
MRILHIIPSLHKGGAERLALDIVRALNRLPGHEARLAVMSPVNEYASEYPDVEPVVLNSKVVPSVSGRWQVDTADWDKLIREFKPQVIHSHLFEAEMLSRYRTLPGVAYATHCHDNMHQFRRLRFAELRNKKRLTEAYERRFMIGRYRSCGNRFLTISQDTHDYFSAQLPPDLAGQVYLFPNAVDVSRFSGCKASFPGRGKIRLINVGSFVEKKNQAFLVEVMRELKTRGLSAELVLAGEGLLREAVSRKAGEFGLADEIRLPGKVSGIERLMGESHVYVHSATYEPFGLVLVEAMAAGLPVVCLNGRGNRELIENGVNGFMVDPPDAAVFADRIIECVSSPETWNRLSTGALAISRRYDMEAYAQRLTGFYTHPSPGA